jgi:HSP20 family protein
MSDWDGSLRDLKAMQRRMNALLEDSRRGASAPLEEPAVSEWIPATDAFETDGEVVLLVDVAGVARDTLELDVDGDRLVLRGERRIPDGLAADDMRRIERPYGAFSRVFELPASVDETGIRAAHRDGVLAIRLPKREQLRDGQIHITVE